MTARCRVLRASLPLFLMGGLALVGCKQRGFNAETDHFDKSNQNQGTGIPFDFSAAIKEAKLKPAAVKVIKKRIQDIDDDAPESVAFNLDVSFSLENADQFNALKARYAKWSKAQTTITFRGPGVYKLEEFLPPAMQASYGKRFVPNGQRNFFMKLDDAKAFPPGADIPEFISFMTNCWTTVYAAMYSSLAADAATQGRFPVFMVNSDITRILANDRYFGKLASGSADQAAALEKKVVAGDIVNVYGSGAITYGQKSILHSAIKVDDNLWFEKTANSGDVAYRFVSFQDIISKYKANEAEFEFRRPTGVALPHPGDVFSVAGMFGESGKTFPAIIKQIISENPYPTPPRGIEGYGIRDVQIQPGSAKQMAKLADNAFDAKTYLLPGEAQRPIEFKDLMIQGPYMNTEDPYATEIREAAVRGLVNGVGPGLFQPAGDVTRAHAAIMVVNVLQKISSGYVNLPAAGVVPFPDVPASHWAARSIAFAKENGIFGGKPGGKFDPDGAVTRAELATVFLKTAKYVHAKRGMSDQIPVIAPGDNTTFGDMDGHWAKSVVETMAKYCQSASVSMAGRDSMLGAFRPDKNATRSYAASSLLRLYHCLSRDKK